MKTVFINELTSGQRLEAEYFLLCEFKTGKTKNGDTFYRLEFVDKTGRIPGIVWANSIENSERNVFKVGDVIAIDATVESFKGTLQISLQRAAKAKEYDEADFLETTMSDVDELWKKLEDTIASIEDKDIKTLLEDIFSDEEFAKKYKKYPAAVLIHHQYASGLLEHVCEMLTIAEALCKYYPKANKDLIKIGIILHDVGKLTEFVPQGIDYIRGVEGRLIGHVVIGAEFFLSKLPKDFPKDLKTKIMHIILSHQGELEYGSPVTPKTIEAAIVRAADDASSKVRQYQKTLKNYEGSDEDFSDYDRFIETEVYLK